jgi:hypothetical protein
VPIRPYPGTATHATLCAVAAALDRWMELRIGRVRAVWIALLPVLAVVGAVNLVAVGGLINASFHQLAPNDWYQFQLAGQRISSGLSPYAVEPPWTFRWSPVAAWLLLALTSVGPLPWLLAQFASLLALPRKVAVLALLTVPFWADVYEGNILTFSLVLAVIALRGSRAASIAYIALVLLVPRPLMFPVAAWLLWQRAWVRWPAVAVFVVHLIMVLIVGYGGEWLQRLASSGDEIALHNAGPSALIGAWWIPIGIALAILFTWRGRLGLASLAVSPYLILYYWIFALLEITPFRRTPES